MSIEIETRSLPTSTVERSWGAVLCEVCRGRTFYAVTAPWPVVRCENCGLVFAIQKPEEQGLTELYEESFAKNRHPTYYFDGSKFAPRGSRRWPVC